MSALTNAGSFAANVTISAGSRFLISTYMRIPKPQAMVFNGVDMLVSAVSSYAFEKYRGTGDDIDDIQNILMSRMISVISAFLVTSYTVGYLHPGTALMLNATAAILGIAFRLFVELPNYQVDYQVFT